MDNWKKEKTYPHDLQHPSTIVFSMIFLYAHSMLVTLGREATFLCEPLPCQQSGFRFSSYEVVHQTCPCAHHPFSPRMVSISLR